MMVLAILEYPGTYTVTDYNDGAGYTGVSWNIHCNRIQ